MAFTIANLESVKDASKFSGQPRGDDWKSLIDDKIRQDELSMTNEMIAHRKKKEEYKQILDMQSKFMGNIKQSKQRISDENNKAERMWLNEKYNQENDLMIDQRMKSMGKLRQINDQNKYLYNIRNRKQSLEKTEGDTYKENPIELRIRTDYIHKLEKNKTRERDILDYNNNAAKMVKMRREHHKEKEKYFSKQFNELIENQAVTHKINRTSQQDKYETKRQTQDLLFLRNRTSSVKKTIDDLIAKYKEANKIDSDEMRELMEMQSSIRKCLIDVDKAESMHPNNLDSFAKDVHSKTNVILDWQVHNKKITAIEAKLKDKEYFNFIRSQADAEIEQINREYAIKKERQSKYLEELQQQERYQKNFAKNLDNRLNSRERLMNNRTSAHHDSLLNGRDMTRNDISSRLKEPNVNNTIDVNQSRTKSIDRLRPQYDALKLPANAYGR